MECAGTREFVLSDLSYCDLGSGIYLGACPKGGDHAEFLRDQLEVDVVINLQTDEDFRALGLRWESMWKALVSKRMNVLRVPIRDMDGRDLSEKLGNAVETVKEALDMDNRVYLHCTVGINRSPTVAIAVLAGPLGMGYHDAVAHVRACRPRVVPDHDAIQDWLGVHFPGSLASPG